MISSKLKLALGSLRTAAVVPGLLAVALATGCHEVPSVVTSAPQGAGNSTPQNDPGMLQIALSVPPNFQIATINYQLSNTGYSQTGSLNVAQSASISATLGNVPAGTGYTLTLTGTDVANKLSSCSGSSPVNVTAGTVTQVSVDVACRVAAPAPAPTVPIPLPAVVLLAGAFLAVGTRTVGARRRR